MTNELLINLVNSVLGESKRTSKGNVAYHCKFCNHHKPKLEINFIENKEGKNQWQCWVCGKKGKTIKSLFKQLGILSEHYLSLSKLVKLGPSGSIKEVHVPQLELPKEYKPLSIHPNKDALKYLYKRNITQNDILRYNIGFCETGEYKDMIIIPSYDVEGKLNYFTARSIIQKSYIKYRNPDVSRDIIPFGLFINWNLPIMLCEGMFDAIAIKNNAIPLLGKNISSSLMKELVKNKVNELYVILDRDAIKQALDFCEKFLNEGKQVYLVELDGKDPSDIGYENISNLIQQTPQLTNKMLMEKKLNFI